MNAITLILCLATSVQGASIVEGPLNIEGDHLRMVVDPALGGVLHDFGFTGTLNNLASGDGLLQEGFGVGSFYVPNRRINEQLEILDDIPGRTILRYTYDCEGPNIRGLQVTRIMEPLRDQASIRITWRVRNVGDESQWVAPWVQFHLAPGGTAERRDRLDVPTADGIEQPSRTGYRPATRNWIAVTDPVAKETVYGVFHADHLHSFQAISDDEGGRIGFRAAFLPRVIKPGEKWETIYRLNAVRGLTHVDFATDELAAQLDYSDESLKVLLSAATALDDVEMRASIRKPDGYNWRMMAKSFSISPGKLVRCTYPWTAPLDGAYDFLAQLRQGGLVTDLGLDTGPPHGGIDARFLVGKPRDTTMEAWTDAPHALDRGPRTLQRTLAAPGETAIWFESSLSKVFREDVPEPVGRIEPTAHVFLAKNERESFQVVIRPPEGTDLDLVQLRLYDLTDSTTGSAIPAADLSASRVQYVPVRVPTHFETATGLYPDPLPPLKPFTAPGGQCSPIWITVYARPETPAGVYQGMLELLAAEAEPIELWIEATVLDFELPTIPALKTDFGYSAVETLRACRSQGFNGSQGLLEQAYLDNALQHRVTLRQLAAMPAETANYGASLSRFEGRLRELLAQGVSTISVPPSLLTAPEQLKMADAFVVEHQLQDRVFCQIAAEPMRNTWSRLLERMEQWRALAPNIPLTVTTFGLDPLLAEACAIWTLHSQVFDTLNNKIILSKIQEGREVWWYVNHMPPRPYANFFIDFAAIEHRLFFWQTRALGIKGVHYRNATQIQPGQNPYDGHLDVTPANGNGLLIYPGPEGPVSSIRWENIRDGIEDYDYLALLMDRIRALKELGGNEALLDQAATAAQLDTIIPNLVTFTRDPSALQNKRAQIAQAILQLDKYLR